MKKKREFKIKIFEIKIIIFEERKNVKKIIFPALMTSTFILR